MKTISCKINIIFYLLLFSVIWNCKREEPILICEESEKEILVFELGKPNDLFKITTYSIPKVFPVVQDESKYYSILIDKGNVLLSGDSLENRVTFILSNNRYTYNDSTFDIMYDRTRIQVDNNWTNNIEFISQEDIDSSFKRTSVTLDSIFIFNMKSNMFPQSVNYNGFAEYEYNRVLYPKIHSKDEEINTNSSSIIWKQLSKGSIIESAIRGSYLYYDFTEFSNKGGFTIGSYGLPQYIVEKNSLWVDLGKKYFAFRLVVFNNEERKNEFKYGWIELEVFKDKVIIHSTAISKQLF